MPILTRPEFGPRTALIYVTVGALIDVWTTVWYFTHEDYRSTLTHFWVIGLVLTGVIFVVLGLLLGRIGQAARAAELPPHEVVHSEAEIQKIAAATTGNPANPQVASPAANVSAPTQSATPNYVS
jgi:hypothetical protein